MANVRERLAVNKQRSQISYGEDVEDKAQFHDKVSNRFATLIVPGKRLER
jgi:hypothetical protein